MPDDGDRGAPLRGGVVTALLTPDEVAQQLAVPRQTLAAWRHRGEGPAYVKLGRHVRYHTADIDAWVARHRRSSTREKAS